MGALFRASLQKVGIEFMGFTKRGVYPSRDPELCEQHPTLKKVEHKKVNKLVKTYSHEIKKMRI